MDAIYRLQDLANEAAKQDEPILDFPLPTEKEVDTAAPAALAVAGGRGSYLNFMEIKDSDEKGKGFYARDDLVAGTFVLVSKPLGIIMGWEEDEFDDDDDGEDGSGEIGEQEEQEEEDDDDLMKSNRRNGVLSIKLAKSIKSDPSLWFDKLSLLFPRDKDSLPTWFCEHAETGMEFERSINELEEKTEFSGKKILIEEIRQRLPFIVRYNCLSIETAPELFVYPSQDKGGHVSLSATGLYYEPSYFNHSHTPNISRWSIGDVMFFVTNQDVKAGTELCISYIESELLCENARIRSNLLEMDFEDIDGDGGSEETEDDEPDGPMINLDVQDELMNMYPLDRLDEINRLLRQSQGDSNEIDMDVDEEEEDIFWFQCDTFRLQNLLALTYESLGQSNKALEQWKKCIEFAEKKLPPADEGSIPLYVQAALCAACTGQESTAKQYADLALRSHSLIFGGGVNFFRKRYAKEMELELRSSSRALSGQAALDALWPVSPP